MINVRAIIINRLSANENHMNSMKNEQEWRRRHGEASGNGGAT